MRAAAVLARLDVRAPLVAATLAVLSLGIGAEIVQRPDRIRLIVAVLLVGAILALATIDARATVLVAFAILPFLGVLRRVLIAWVGVSAHDPLVLIGPALVGILALRLFVIERRPIAGDRLSQLMVALFVLAVIQSVNPAGGSLVAGAGGLLYVAVPLLWYFVGRELVDDVSARRLVILLIVAASGIAAYGLYQVFNRLPSWDARWVEVAGYAALNVRGALRPFGTFPSTTEYAMYLGIACLACLALLLHRRPAFVAVLPLAATAMFMSGSRGPVVLCIFGVFVLMGLRTGTVPRTVAIIALGSVAALVAVTTYRPAIEARSAATENALVDHQVGGLTDPLNPERSTLWLHLEGALGGIEQGLRDPLGKGTAAISLGGSRLGGKGQTREIDVSNAFVGLGLPGGILFVLIVVLAVRRTIAFYLRRRDPIALVVVATLVMSFGQWLNGGLYTVVPLVWLLLGWVVAQTRGDRPVVRPRAA